jgi:outer membrane protein assembly factor BamA
MAEVAMPPGSAQYIRAEIVLEKHTTLLPNKQNPKIGGIVGSLCGAVATTRVLDFSSLWATNISDSDDNNVHINGKGERKLCHMSDRYFLGGPLSLRGMHLNGAGPRGFRPPPAGAGTGAGAASPPRDVGDALGGLTKITGLAALSAPLPFSFQSSESMKTLLFLNGAILLPHTVFPLALPKQNNIFSCLRVSVGAGLSYSMGPARLELTYALPLLTSSHDNTKSFQIGVALGMNNN